LRGGNSPLTSIRRHIWISMYANNVDYASLIAERVSLNQFIIKIRDSVAKNATMNPKKKLSQQRM
jgi:hypothetical protein